MDQVVTDFTASRNWMVDGQVRPNKVTNPLIIEAMRRIARERFLPTALATLAYVDIAVELGAGRAMPQPMMTARLLQLAAPQAGDRALVVGSGAGYTAAVLAACGADVTALEDDAALNALAAAVPASEAGAVKRVSGPLAAGWAAHAPYDLILIDGAVDDVPAALASQLAPTGRLIAVQMQDGFGRAVRGMLAGGQLAVVAEFDCNAPVLPAFRRAAGFTF